ncbi:hypothetical protein B0A50_06532 [Salinomyces thailandicus]|uniref:Uncharacterized protein n=1 Tax=Salinomyces thailandicus TaxID=706561 RepID=A0A4U0TPD1_9PEZI|nr:hypothetical protein B0A50_06532 [Salinomyces thailandica]
MSNLRLTLKRCMIRVPPTSQRLLSSTAATRAKKPTLDNSSIFCGAEHKPSMGGASLGHLVSELSATKAGMEHIRREGETMNEDQRAMARNLAKWIVGLPMAFAGAVGGIAWLKQDH